MKWVGIPVCPGKLCPSKKTSAASFACRHNEKVCEACAQPELCTKEAALYTVQPTLHNISVPSRLRGSSCRPNMNPQIAVGLRATHAGWFVARLCKQA